MSTTLAEAVSPDTTATIDTPASTDTAEVTEKPKRTRAPRKPKAAPAAQEAVTVAEPAVAPEAQAVTLDPPPAGWDETATGPTDVELEAASQESAAALAESPIADEPAATPEPEPSNPAPFVLADAVPVAGLAYDDAATHEVHRVIRVMSKEVKAACTLMFKPAPLVQDVLREGLGGDAFRMCADCVIMWDKGLGQGDPDDEAAVTAAVETLRSGKVAIPSVSETAEAPAEFRHVLPVAGGKDVILPRSAPPAFDALDTLRTVLFNEPTLADHIRQLRDLFTTGKIRIGDAPAAARTASAPRASSAPRATSSRPAPGGLPKLRGARASGPFILGYRSGGNWIIRDTRPSPMLDVAEIEEGKGSIDLAKARLATLVSETGLTGAALESAESAAKSLIDPTTKTVG